LEGGLDNTFKLVIGLIGLATAIVTYAAARIQFTTAMRTVTEYNEPVRKIRREIKHGSPGFSGGLSVRAQKADLVIESQWNIYTAEIDGFGVGVYHLDHRQNELLDAVISSISNRLSNIDEEEIRVEILGCADGISMKPGAKYRGDLGSIDVNYFSQDSYQDKKMRLAPGYSLKNEYVACLRALVVFRKLATALPMDEARYVVFTSTTHEIGPQHRRVAIKVTLPNYLQEEFKELPLLAKALLNN